MNVDKFGHHIHKNKSFKHGVISTDCVLDITNDGQLDAKDKLIKNVQLPKDIQDCATKGYVDEFSHEFLRRLQLLEETFSEFHKIIESSPKFNDSKKNKK